MLQQHYDNLTAIHINSHKIKNVSLRNIATADFDLKRLWYVKDVLRFLLNVNYFSKYLDALNKTIRNNEEVIEILSYFIDRYFVFALSKYNISRLFIYVLQLAYLQFFVY